MGMRTADDGHHLAGLRRQQQAGSVTTDDADSPSVHLGGTKNPSIVLLDSGGGLRTDWYLKNFVRQLRLARFRQLNKYRPHLPNS
jgi:hypothetical protein